jgi:CheY-like chemotaxis protein
MLRACHTKAHSRGTELIGLVSLPSSKTPCYNAAQDDRLVPGALEFLDSALAGDVSKVLIEASMAPSAPDLNPRLPRILIADDNPQGVELLEAYLCDGDYEIRTAADGEETLAQVHQWQPDLILLDIMMPKISGFEVCKRLRANPQTHDIGVIMITALDQPTDIDKAVDAGTDDYLTKPLNKSALLLRIRAFLEARKNRRDLDQALAYIEAVERGSP